MRIGFNPNKDKIQESNEFFHQVIVPVYIPNQEGYFKDSFAILQYCLQSLFKTSHPKTYFTIVNNGSCDEVVNYLNALHQENKIQELIHTTNIGKLNAILKGIAGQQFPLITITDADVLFLNDWQKATYQIFETFPKAGVVSTTPSSKMIRYFTSNVLFNNILSNQMRFTQVANPDAMKSFAESIGNPSLYNECHLEKYLTISKGNVKAVIGAGHFVATYRGSIFDNLEQRNTIYNLGGNSEGDILDKPVVENGFWRLSTENNYTFHMGNTVEDWMLKQVEGLHENNYTYKATPKLAEVSFNHFANWFAIKIFSKALFIKLIWMFFLRYKGLSKEKANHY
jgi:hypothetical protein